MQKNMLFLVVVFFSNQSLGMNAFKALEVLSSADVQAIAQKTVHKKAKHDDAQDLQPPELFRIMPQKTVQELLPEKESISRVSSCEFVPFLEWADLNLEFDDFIVDGLCYVPPSLPPLYYLMFYDYNIKNVRTFSADTKSELLKQYLICFINEANTQTSRDTQAHLHAKAPSMPIKLQGSYYALVCNAGGGLCRHTEVAQSRESLAVHLFAHFVVEHKKDSAWYKNISKNIAGTLEEAWVKLYGRRF